MNIYQVQTISFLVQKVYETEKFIPMNKGKEKILQDPTEGGKKSESNSLRIILLEKKMEKPDNLMLVSLKVHVSGNQGSPLLLWQS